MTKQEDLLKGSILDENLELTKIELIPQLVDNTTHIHAPLSVHINTDKITQTPKKCTITPTTKKPTTTTKTQLYKATNHLYNLENHHTPEKILNIDLNLYQMEEP
ncbi:MAG: hypothetical protein FWD52_06420 [Candidatus Bathyarchaeota archaeon]|nr:hypothetical protein [Candidatus Termiticorpusculum sp.]